MYNDGNNERREHDLSYYYYYYYYYNYNYYYESMDLITTEIAHLKVPKLPTRG